LRFFSFVCDDFDLFQIQFLAHFRGAPQSPAIRADEREWSALKFPAARLAAHQGLHAPNLDPRTFAERAAREDVEVHLHALGHVARAIAHDKAYGLHALRTVLQSVRASRLDHGLHKGVFVHGMLPFSSGSWFLFGYYTTFYASECDFGCFSK
jgi:hypothetical protein